MNNIFNLITYKKKNAIIVGSKSDPNIDYSNDTDIFEEIIVKETKQELIDETYKMIEKIISKINKNKNIIFAEFKAGIYDAMYITDDDILNKTKRRKFYKSKLDNKIINKDLYDTILSLKNEELVYFCSNLYKIRWTIEDLKQKQVKLFNNEIYHFESIFDKPSVIKIDIFFFNGNYFEPFSNMFKIVNNGKILTDEQEPKESLKEDIKDLIKENNIFKAVKRAYSLAKINNEQQTQEQLLKVINSHLGEQYQLLSNINNCEEVLYLKPNKKVFLQVKHALEYFVKNYDIKANIKNLLTKAQQKKTVKPLIKILIRIQNNLFEKINRDTKKILNKYKINI